ACDKLRQQGEYTVLEARFAGYYKVLVEEAQGDAHAVINAVARRSWAFWRKAVSVSRSPFRPPVSPEHIDGPECWPLRSDSAWHGFKNIG
ncbi:hypothetical protein FK513_29850, partial [Klebsiella pneumoniae]|nr:hypothetical protein [Klebsiella pneumoniae]